MARFSFGSGFDPRNIDEFIELARTADAAGLTMVGTGDTPALLGDCYVGMTLLAEHTSSSRLITWMTNPVTRHPVVTAAAISSIDALSGGRAILGLATGDSGVYNLGLKPASQTDLETYISTLRRLWSDGSATYRGQTVNFTWSRQPIPIYIAAGGPKGLRTAGRIADGVVVEAGLVPEVIEDSLARLEAGAKESGRSLSDLDIWWHVRANFGASIEDAVTEIRSPLAGMANRLLRFGAQGKLVPPALIPKFEELSARYQLMHHEEHGSRLQNGPLIDELGLRDYLTERFGLVGTPGDWIQRVRALEGQGVHNIAMSAMMPDKIGFLTTLARDVLPALNG